MTPNRIRFTKSTLIAAQMLVAVFALAPVPRSHAGAKPRSVPTKLADRLDASLNRGGLRGAQVGVLVRDLATGEILYQRNADELYVPASVTKIVTSAAALSILSPQYHFRTEISGHGTQKGNTWIGDLYLRALGDPVLVEERVWQLVRQLKDRGIRRVDGDLVVDDGFFDLERFGYDWGARTRAAYGAPHGAVSVNFNTVPTRGRRIAIDEDPSWHAGEYLMTMMSQAGIVVDGELRTGEPTPDGARRLARSRSKSLGAIVADLNKTSSNFIAEQLLKTIGAETGSAPGTASDGIAAVQGFLSKIGIPEDGYSLFDGSGLSKSNRLSPRTIVDILDNMARDFVIGPEFISSLRVSGAEGGRSRFQDPLCRRRMRFKTGHLNGVNTLAGYGETKAGRRLVFSIMANRYRRGRYAADRGIEDLCEIFLDSAPNPDESSEGGEAVEP